MMFFVRMKDQVKIAVYDLNPNVSQCVLMIHGWPLSEKIFEYQKELLTNSGYRVVTMDLRGFGNSDAPAHGYSYNQFSEDIYTVVQSLNLKSFALVGFSMGGAIALRYMARFQQYGVSKLILLAAAAPCYTKRPGFPYGVTKASVDQLIALARVDRPQLNENFSRMLLASPHSNAVKNWFMDIGLTASGIGTIKAAISLRDENGIPDISKVTVPTGIFHGKKDQIVPFELGVVQNKNIPGSKLFPFENSGHGIFYDELRDFNQRFITYLKS